MPDPIATQAREEEVLIVTECLLGVILPTLQIRELRLRAGKIIQFSNQNHGANSDLGFLWLNYTEEQPFTPHSPATVPRQSLPPWPHPLLKETDHSPGAILRDPSPRLSSLDPSGSQLQARPIGFAVLGLLKMGSRDSVEPWEVGRLPRGYGHRVDVATRTEKSRCAEE